MARSSDDYSSSRSAGTKSNPAAHFVRFTEDDNARLKKAVERRGGSIQSFLHDAAMTAIEEQSRWGKRKASSSSPMEITPRGFGLREKLRDLPSYAESMKPPPEPPPAPAPQILINTGGSTSTPEVDRLAKFVVSGGPPGERDRRHEVAAKILAVSAIDTEDQERLARALDAKIAAVEPKSSSALDTLTNWLFGK